MPTHSATTSDRRTHELRDPSAPAFFAWVVASNNLTMPSGEPYENAYRMAAKRLANSPPDWEPGVLDSFVGQLEDRGLDEQARSLQLERR